MKQLIPLAYLNEACSVSLNVLDTKLKADLDEAQSDLRDVLGAEFYAEIESQYDIGNNTLSAANAALYDPYIKQFLAWQAYFYSLGFSQSASTPTGEREFSDANSTILADVKLYSKEKNVRRRASRYKYDLINYLRIERSKDSTAFPLWSDSCRDEISFAISSIERDAMSDNIFSINKATNRNE